MFADVVATVYQPGDYVWVHDYHLMRLPYELRRRFPDIPVGWSVFFVARIWPHKHFATFLLGADPAQSVVLRIVVAFAGFCTRHSLPRRFTGSCQ